MPTAVKPSARPARYGTPKGWRKLANTFALGTPQFIAQQ